jgi:hypothetical protein
LKLKGKVMNRKNSLTTEVREGSPYKAGRSMKRETRMACGVTATVLMAALGGPATSAVAAPLAPQTVIVTSGTGNTMAVTGTFKGRIFNGTASNLSAAAVNGKAVLKGTISGAGLNATSFTADVKAVTAAPPDPAAPPVAAPAPVAPTTPMPALPPRSTAPLCEVLTLDVDNLHLDLLGLKVLIPPPGLHVVVAGQARPGALLGNLLCNLAGGLDGSQPGAAPAPAVAPAPAPVAAPPVASAVAPVASAVAPVTSAVAPVVAPVVSAVAPVVSAVAPVAGALPGK